MLRFILSGELCKELALKFSSMCALHSLLILESIVCRKVKANWSGWAKSPTENFRNKTASLVARQFTYFAELKMGEGEKVLKCRSLGCTCCELCYQKSVTWGPNTFPISYSKHYFLEWIVQPEQKRVPFDSLPVALLTIEREKRLQCLISNISTKHCQPV